MQAVTVTDTRIHCDTCEHEFHGEPPEWHNKPCPACGAENIITDQDMAVWTGMRELMGVVNALAGDIPDDHGEGGIAFSFDTAGLRSNDRGQRGAACGASAAPTGCASNGSTE